MLRILIPVVFIAPLALLVFIIARAWRRGGRTGAPDRWSTSAKVAFGLYVILTVCGIVLNMQLAPESRGIDAAYGEIHETSAWNDAFAGFALANLVSVPVTAGFYGALVLFSRVRQWHRAH
jgi:hypothetical protein